MLTSRQRRLLKRARTTVRKNAPILIDNDKDLRAAVGLMDRRLVDLDFVVSRKRVPLENRTVVMRQIFMIRTPEKFTCYECPQKYECQYAYDLYNLHGECLAMK